MRSPLIRIRRARLPIGHLLRLGTALAIILALGAGVARGSATAAPPANTSSPTITGTAQQGQTLTATTGVWNGDTPISYTFQWQRCDSAGAACGSIAGATAQSRVVEAGDVGGTLRVVVTATNASGTSSAASGPTAKIAAPGSAPSPTKQPDPHGSYQIGQTINVDTGTWTGTAPITFGFQWQRCSSNGSSCGNISGATGQSFLLSAVDLGFKLRAIVTATNAVGSAGIVSNQTPVIVAPGTPVNTVAPAIANATALAAGDVASGFAGTWIGDQPITYSYTWSKCDAAGKSCRVIPGETGASHTVAVSEVGATLLLSVRASNRRGSSTANSPATAPIKASGLPAGAIRLADGKISIPASSVALPNRLVISDVGFSPAIIRSRNTFSARFRVTDTRGYVVRDVLVYTIGLPYSYVRATPETPTGSDGYAVMNITPTANLPLSRGGAIVFFVRARKTGDGVLAGVSTRRLVQVTVSR
ncbi:hypothetical protein Gocc_2098 [Gaiella occulta]|uniref:Fibronectin type-III domain-containing protein n=1 Tax=Gaiella occulta TaxID=1002870 RepID=A0A7M2YV29_9ACTN|nr:hypothetical protein [Gaiella occulta]RDI74001.1 hypothetical protein Gocc_2098 [Gaiella occulta]